MNGKLRNRKLRIAFFVITGLILVGIASIRFSQRNMFTVSGENMLPNLAPKELVEVDRDAFDERAPERGEVVLYLAKKEEPSPRIGRVVGVPGDRVAFIKGRLYVNNEPPLQSSELAQHGNIRMEQVTENLSGRTYKVWYVVGLNPAPDISAEVGEGEYFIAGDHRDNSSDSRFVGKIPKENLVGAVLMPTSKPL